MNVKHKKWYIVIFFFLIIVLCAYFMISGKLAEPRRSVSIENRNTTYATVKLHETSQQSEIDDAKKEEYKQDDLERSLQEMIQLIVEGSDSQVSIQNFNSADASASAVSVTLYTDHGDDISKEQREGIERTISGGMDGLLKENITINISASED